MNIAGIIICFLLLLMAVIILRKILLKGVKKPICQACLVMTFGGAVLLFSLMILALILGMEEERGYLTNLMGISALTSACGVFISQIGRCGPNKR